MEAARVRLAPAKINLALHVTGRREDGYHFLSSLVAFADIGDHLTFREGERRLREDGGDDFSLEGPFAAALAASLTPGAPNIVATALGRVRALARERGLDLRPLVVTLDKQLPVASGIGGGSADAAAVLREAAARLPQLGPEIRDLAAALGADVPMCFDGRAAVATGIGEALAPIPAFPELFAVLVNPGVAVSTPAVFARLRSRTNPPLPELAPLRTAADVASYLRHTRNDLEAAAETLAPAIAAARAALVAAGAALARMSGSGATVFALFATQAAAEAAARALTVAEPGWWVVATRLGSRPDR